LATSVSYKNDLNSYSAKCSNGSQVVLESEMELLRTSNPIERIVRPGYNPGPAENIVTTDRRTCTALLSVFLMMVIGKWKLSADRFPEKD
jgi:hypothetical protein